MVHDEILVVEPAAVRILAFVKIIAVLCFEYEGMVVVLEHIVTKFAILILAPRLDVGAAFWLVENSVEMAIWVTATIAEDESDLGEGFGADDGVRGDMVLEVGMEVETKKIRIVVDGARVNFELGKELAIVVLGGVFAPIFLLFFHVMKLLHLAHLHSTHTPTLIAISTYNINHIHSSRVINRTPTIHRIQHLLLLPPLRNH